jgi:trehalose 6-phosphate phosphatase
MSKSPLAEPPALELERTALFLDYDGTLVPIAPIPEAAVADDAVLALLEALERRLGGALAVVSGRPVADIDRMLAPLRLTIAGLHGLELRRNDDGAVVTPDAADASLARARAALRLLHDRIPGTLFEDKRLTVALHYRGAPAAEEEVRALGARLVEESNGALQLLPGKMVVELLPAGRDKGRAIGGLLALEGFAGRQPVFVGDDVTDEAGFRVINERGGISVRVGTTERHTAARWGLADVAALRRWLELALARDAG